MLRSSSELRRTGRRGGEAYSEAAKASRKRAAVPRAATLAEPRRPSRDARPTKARKAEGGPRKQVDREGWCDGSDGAKAKRSEAGCPSPAAPVGGVGAGGAAARRPTPPV